MGMEQSIQSSGVLPDLKIKLSGISNVQPNGGVSDDVAQRATEEAFVEDELEKPEEEVSPDEEQGTAARHEILGQTCQEREKSDFVSVPEKISKEQENHQKGDGPVSVPKSAMDPVEESKMTSEIHAAGSCTGDNTKGTEAQPRDLTSSGKNLCAEQGCELGVGGQYFEPTVTQQALSDAHEKRPTINDEWELADAKTMAHRKSETTSATDETTNFTEVDLATPVLSASMPSLVPREWTSLQPSAKPQPEIRTTKEPTSIKGVDEAFPGEPALEEAGAPKVAKSGEGLLSKESAQISAELRAPPVPHQEEAVAKDAEKTEACLDNMGFPVCVEKLTDAPNEQDSLLRPLISKKKKRFCCTVL